MMHNTIAYDSVQNNFIWYTITFDVQLYYDIVQHNYYVLQHNNDVAQHNYKWGRTTQFHMMYYSIMMAYLTVMYVGKQHQLFLAYSTNI
jgi:hypothetical protein